MKKLRKKKTVRISYDEKDRINPHKWSSHINCVNFDGADNSFTRRGTILTLRESVLTEVNGATVSKLSTHV